jgi:methionyl-tRNA formyltransferase
MITKEDGKINWNNTACKIYNQYRAYKNWPKIFCFWEKNGQTKKITLNKVEILEGQNYTNKKIGETFITENETLAVNNQSEIIVIKKIQLEGKKSMTANDFLNGQKKFIGSILK